MAPRDTHSYVKGVIEILSSNLELGGLNFHGDKIDNSTCIGCLYPARPADYIAYSVWGYCFIRGIGTPRPEIWIRQDTILTPFLCPIITGFNGG